MGKKGFKKNRALLVVDPQIDFCPGGALAVPDADKVLEKVTQFIRHRHRVYRTILISRDWHIKPGKHFASSIKTVPTNEPDYIDTWPDHCVALTPGAMFHPAFDMRFVNLFPYHWIINKGMYGPGYSAFDPDALAETERHTKVEHPFSLLEQTGIGIVDVVGIETNHCVKASVLSLREKGYETNCYINLCAALTKEAESEAVVDMVKAGANIVAAARSEYT